MVKLNKINIVYGVLVVVSLLQACRNKCSEGERGNPYIRMAMTVMPGTDSVNLGDTLTVSIEIPFDNINTRDGSRIDISRSTISEFGMDHGVSFKTSSTSHVTNGLDQFKIIYERGGGERRTLQRVRKIVLKKQPWALFSGPKLYRSKKG